MTKASTLIRLFLRLVTCTRHYDTSVPGGIYTVSKLLGHSRVSTTKIYLHCSQKQLEQAMLADPLGAGATNDYNTANAGSGRKLSGQATSAPP